MKIFFIPVIKSGVVLLICFAVSLNCLAQNVGIGTSTPDSKLHIFNETGYTVLKIANNDATSGSAVVFTSNNFGAFAQIGLNGSTHPLLPNALFITQNGNHPIKFATTFIDRMIITGTGNVGIGTNIPEAKLDIVGKVKIADGTQGAGKVLTSDANGLASWQPVAVTKAYFSSFLYNSPAFVLTSGVEKTADFSSIRFNNNISYVGGTITVPDAGLYHFDIVGSVANTYANVHQIQIITYINGGLNDQAFSIALSKDLLLNANDQVVFTFIQNTGSNVTLGAFSRISCHKVY